MHGPEREDHQPRLTKGGDHEHPEPQGEQQAHVPADHGEDARVRLLGPLPLVLAREVRARDHDDERGEGQGDGHRVGALQPHRPDRQRADGGTEEQARAQRAAEQGHPACEPVRREDVDHEALPGEEEGARGEAAEEEPHPHEPQGRGPAGEREREDVEDPGTPQGASLPDPGDEGTRGEHPDELPDAGERDDEGCRPDARVELDGTQRRDRHDRAHRRGAEQRRAEGRDGDAPPREPLAAAHPVPTSWCPCVSSRDGR